MHRYVAGTALTCILALAGDDNANQQRAQCQTTHRVAVSQLLLLLLLFVVVVGGFYYHFALLLTRYEFGFFFLSFVAARNTTN